jgi:hypothetical protein
MTNTSSALALSMVTVAVTALTALPALPAAAKDGDVIRRGACEGSTNWKLKAGPEDGRIEVEGEIDSNRTGQTWRWRLRHNGDLTASGTKTTKGPSGSFEVRRVLVNLSGPDRIVFRARNLRSGEVCRGTVTF